MWNVRLDEPQAGINVVGRHINNLRYTDDNHPDGRKWTTLLMRDEEESEKAGLKLNIQKTKIMASGPITSWQIQGEKMKTEADFIFLVSKTTLDSNCSHKVKRWLLLGRNAMTNLDSVL